MLNKVHVEKIPKEAAEGLKKARDKMQEFYIARRNLRRYSPCPYNGYPTLNHPYVVVKSGKAYLCKS